MLFYRKKRRMSYKQYALCRCYFVCFFSAYYFLEKEGKNWISVDAVTLNKVRKFLISLN